MTAPTGIVLIGRNEGERLHRALRSLEPLGLATVYVDSGSSDGSARFAAERGATVRELDAGAPFTAARARNAGLKRLLEVAPDVELVMFLDGDCEIAPGWLDAARPHLESDPSLAAVSGRRREAFPERSIFARLLELEWRLAARDPASFGGDVLFRVRAFREVGGFDPARIAGEEADLYLRLLSAGWTTRRIDAPMSVHDGQVDRFGQWWTRTVRGGYAFAEGAATHGWRKGWRAARQSLSIVALGFFIPLLAVALAPTSRGLSLLLFAVYPALYLRIFWMSRRSGLSTREALAYSGSCLAGKLPQLLGQIRFAATRLTGGGPRPIEYK